MKTTLLVLVSIVVWSCSGPAPNGDKQPASDNAKKGHQHDASTSGLTLNNGAKWDADESTNNQVKILGDILVRFDDEENITLESYLNTGNELQSGIESLIQGCRMQGPDHDALHLWLEPLMNYVKNLQESTAMDQAVKNHKLIRKQVSIYAEYFE